MAAFRAVENGMSIYRQTGSGVSSVIDPYGRTIQRVDGFETEASGDFAAVQTVQTPIGSVDTLYPVMGDAVGNVMLVLAAGLLLGLLWRRNQRVASVKAKPVSM
jgi:apolipoprotein N-acyltransferase